MVRFMEAWNSFLIECLETGRDDLFDDAIKNGADLTQLEDGDDIVSMAINTERIDIVERILKAGGDPNVKTNFNGRTSLFYATARDDDLRFDMVCLLIKYGAVADRDIDEKGGSCVHEAAEKGQLETLKVLVESGAAKCLRSFDEIDRTPLHCACAGGHVEAVKYLLSVGADINANNHERIGDTALSDVAQTCSPEMAELLLENGANPLVGGWMHLSAYDHALERKKPDGLIVIALMERYIRERGYTRIQGEELNRRKGKPV